MALLYPEDPLQLRPQLYADYPNPATVAVTGAVDLATAHLFEQHIFSALSRRPSCLVIDLNAVTFLGSMGLSVLLQARMVAEQQDTVLVLRGARHRRVALPLKIMGVWSMFLIE